MPRTREYDEQTALDGAMKLFWRRGYQAASLPDLLDATDLSRSSFYDAFGTKRDLLLASLHRYADSAMAGLIEPLLLPNAGRREIELTFDRMITHALGPDGQRGCLVNNCMAEVAPHDEAVRQATLQIRRELENAFTRALKRAQGEGTVAVREKPRALARFLVNTISGINLAAKNRPTRAALEDIVRIALRTLD